MLEGEKMSQCPIGTFPYTIQQGDTLWRLAQRYNTSVNALIATNPNINPTNLLVGQVICIPPGKGISKAELDLRKTMRLLWEQHVEWTRMAIISIAEDLPDVDLVINQLLRNPSDFEAALKPIYGIEKASKVSNLLKNHLEIAAELVKDAKAGNTQAAKDAEKRWYANADEIAIFLNSINPYWPKEALMEMLHEHLSLTKSEAIARINKDYATDISLYDKVETQALSMADALSDGIVKQFPELFI